MDGREYPVEHHACAPNRDRLAAVQSLQATTYQAKTGSVSFDEGIGARIERESRWSKLVRGWLVTHAAAPLCSCRYRGRRAVAPASSRRVGLAKPDTADMFALRSSQRYRRALAEQRLAVDLAEDVRRKLWAQLERFDPDISSEITPTIGMNARPRRDHQRSGSGSSAVYDEHGRAAAGPLNKTGMAGSGRSCHSRARPATA